MSDLINKKPEIVVFAGPNGSGKTTITKMAKIVGLYINADEIKQSISCSDLEAAKKAEELRNKCIEQNLDFTFETVLSTNRNLDLLMVAKQKGYFIRAIYVFTSDPKINVYRVKQRLESGGHSVPEEKIISRYYKSLNNIPELVRISDICHIYDNTINPFRIFKKRKDLYFYWENEIWNKISIEKITNIKLQ